MLAKKIIKYFLQLIYYLIVLTILTPICGVFLLGVYKNFMISSISFTLDTLFLDWNTTFASITVCEIYNGEKNFDLNEEFFGIDRDYILDDFVGDVVFYRGQCESCFKCDNITCPSNFSELFENFRTACTDLLSECNWNGELFECCDHFKHVATEFGPCYSFNSIQAGDSESKIHYMNREIGPGNLTFVAHEDIQIYVHPPNDIPYFFSEGVIKETVLLGTNKDIILNVMEIYNDPSVYHTAPSFRNCRFSYEVLKKENALYRYYSYSSCIVDCAVKLQLEICGCHFFNNNKNDSLCDIEGLQCLTKNFEIFKAQREDCFCMSSCEEPEYNVVYTSPEQSNEEGTDSSVEITMIDLPTQRYIRNVVKTDLDLFISIGGIVGLFFGVSFISVIEMVYKIFERLKTRRNRKVGPESSDKLQIF